MRCRAVWYKFNDVLKELRNSILYHRNGVVTVSFVVTAIRKPQIPQLHIGVRAQVTSLPDRHSGVSSFNSSYTCTVFILALLFVDFL